MDTSWWKANPVKILVNGEVKSSRVRELKIESHPHRQPLQADLLQNNAHNPFCEESKVMIREICNAGLLGLCETIPKVQCSECLHNWNQGIVYCTCGHLLKETLMATGCFLNPELRHQEENTSWFSAGKNRHTERAFCGPQRADEMYQKEF